jgi:three-Cys-motif partner protein
LEQAPDGEIMYANSARRKTMQPYLQPQDDGLAMRTSGSWVVEKLDYLKRYIDMFATSMHKKPWRERHYIDLFAGPGKCRVPETDAVYLGSPLLALTTRYSFTGYVFVDLSAERITALQQRCSVSPLHNRVRYSVGDSNAIAKDIVEHILAIDGKYIPGQWSSINLAFLDPDGLQLHWDTVAALAQVSRMDLIIHYPQMALTRNMLKEYKVSKQTKIDLFFGGREWRGIYEGYRRKEARFIHRKLMDLYREKLLKLGYQEVLRDDEVGDEPLIRNAEKNAPLYRLLFASKHPLGHNFWRKVVSRDVHGQTRLL